MEFNSQLKRWVSADSSRRGGHISFNQEFVLTSSERNWDRYISKARLVHQLGPNYDYDPFRLDPRVIAQMMLYARAAKEDLLPNLRAIHWNYAEEEDESFNIVALIPPTLISLKLGIISKKIKTEVFTRALHLLKDRLPVDLQALQIDIDFVGYRGDARDLIQAPLGEIIQHLPRLTSLRLMFLVPPATLTRIRGGSLRTIELALLVDSLPLLATCLATLAMTSPLVEDLELFLDELDDAVVFQGIEPLLTCGRLISLKIRGPQPVQLAAEDIMTMGAAWTNMRDLCLCPYPTRANRDSPATSLSLLTTFAAYFKKLELLVMCFSYDEDILPIAKQPFSNLRRLHFGTSQAPKEKASSIAAFLLGLCPNGIDIWVTVDDDEPQEEEIWHCDPMDLYSDIDKPSSIGWKLVRESMDTAQALQMLSK